ncbi:hypothetical protein AB0D38_08900 [Streptomyces sp. NPDC048279]|uniref:hypothetical protein n=1 Tax=Streptomyces sp. NPDC048279 TaxID=3154714 RepID=UPI00343A2E45
MSLSNPPSPVAPTYPLGGVNQSIVLHSGDLTAFEGGTAVTVDGTIRWDWLPTPRITYTFSTDDPKTNVWNIDGNIEASIPDGEPLLPNVAEATETQEELAVGALAVEGRLAPVMRGSASDVRRVVFQLPNLPQVHGEWIRGFGHRWNGRWLLEAGDWRFIIDDRHDRIPVQSELRRTGGYVFTHVGEFVRQDGAAMPEEEISTVLHLLRCVLSFAFGRAISPALASGYDSSEALTWLDWRVFHIAPWQPAAQVIDETGLADLKLLFSGFGSLWSDQFARDLLSNAVSYYLECIVMNPLHLATSAGQAGLELLAYERLVEEQQVLTSAQYKSRTAHENIISLLSSHGASHALPSSLTNLTKAAGSANPPCKSGPEIITRMRNGVIHPSRKKPKFTTDEWLEAWELVSSYLVLSILGRVSFNGRYRDPVNPQRHPGAVTKVPWAP